MGSIYAPTAIDLSRLPAPEAIEALDFENLLSAFNERFLTYWNSLREINTALPEYTTINLESESAGVIGKAWSYTRLLDRQHVNDVFKALLLPLAKGANLDVLVAGRNIQRQVAIPATSTTAAVMESDDSLLRRYLYSFDSPAAGSSGRYLYDAWAAWPGASDGTGMLDARVNGYAVHGRRGDIDLVIAGPGGRMPTTQELLTVRNAVTNIDRAPEGVAITVLGAARVEYQPSLIVEVPGAGPAPETIQQEAEARVRAAAADRLLIGGEIPAGYLLGAAYGPNVISAREPSPILIPADPYKIPVMTGLTVSIEVRG